ncbi:hypothetical protein BJP25_16650 [Actinokineospora bangkokensis]|uniref:Insecticide toxin TcdB middle/N-terminal domain-containing protein n=1 Tax=Actinokineospora bangkokensis TaxID=1193682 RepID=A0A1Q9LPB9_9PSEU|nr:hypothetical protein BJP25_16650 [Actinokineospora bangkokensis]
MEFTYSPADLAPTTHSVEGAPDGAAARWVDLDGEGVPGALVTGAGAWYFHRNLSPLGAPAFARAAAVATTPGDTEGRQLLDLAGDGSLDLVDLSGPVPGFAERTADGWAPWRAFAALPVVDWADPGVQFVDLTGDGRADALAPGEPVPRWHPALGEAGFGGGLPVEAGGGRPWDATRDEAVFFADLTGDGLADLVRVRPGEVVYWPALGHGRFGARVDTEGAPRFDTPDLFDARRLRWADVDGSGPTDLLYLGRDGVQVHRNLSGDSWVLAGVLDAVPPLDTDTTVEVVDLLGDGTACLTWSSARLPLACTSLHADKPHLLTGVDNNLGLRTRVEYTPSTRYHQRDRQDGSPWATRLPFPVHCVSRTVVTDAWRGTRFATDYSYHHGHYDGVERAFHGFGRVEQVDVESFEEFAGAAAGTPFATGERALQQAAVKTVSWFHTGAEVDLSAEHAPGPDVVVAGVEVVDDLDPEERRQAVRAAKGTLLRRERHQLDALGAPARLLSAETTRVGVRLVRRGPVHSVFQVVDVESASQHHELDVGAEPDPRTTHTLTLRTDDLGNPLQVVTATYPRRGSYTDELPAATVAAIRALQRQVRVTHVETRYTDDVTGADDHRPRLPCETRTHELTGLIPRNGTHFTTVELRELRLSQVHQDDGVPVPDQLPHRYADGLGPRRRLVAHSRTLFSDGHSPAPWRGLTGRGLVHEHHRLALTEALLTEVYGAKLTSEVRAALDDPARSGYLTGAALADRFPGEDTAGQFWARSGTAGFTDDPAATFFQPTRFTDPYGAVTTQTYDARALHVATSVDAAGNTTTVERYDHRVLAPAVLRDVNDNRTEVAFDALGTPVALSVLGKGDADDPLPAALLDPPPDEVAAFLNRPDLDEPAARRWLAGATVRYLHDLGGRSGEDGSVVWAAHPPAACTLRRERHLRSPGGASSPVQAAFVYSDGAGSTLLRKVPAAPAEPGGPVRWVASGRVVVNNKGNPVLAYEPAFADPDIGLRYETPPAAGLATTTHYDAVDRVVRVDLPDGAVRRTEFSPWHVTTWDENDAVMGSEWYAQRAGLPEDSADGRAARLAAEHAGTPTTTLLDGPGRVVAAVAHNRVRDDAGAVVDERSVTVTRFDHQDNPLWTRDARGNLVVQVVQPAGPVRGDGDPAGRCTGYDLLGNALVERGADTGSRWRLPDATGALLFAWDERGTPGGPVTTRVHRTDRDLLRRPVAQWFADGGEPPVLVSRYAYRDGTDAEGAELNLHGRLHQHHDEAGLVTTARVDVDGNVVEVTRRLLADHRAARADWSGDPAALLDTEEFTEASEFDALGRVTRRYDWHRGVGARVAVHDTEYDAGGAPTAIRLLLRAIRTGTGHTEDADTRATTVVERITYDASGHRSTVRHGNGTTTTHEVDPATRRPRRLSTTRTGAAAVQDLHFTHDAVGNLVEVRDDAVQPAFFANQVVDARTRYTYDACYRLTSATGRENGAALGAVGQDTPAAERVGFPVTTPGTLRSYSQDYTHDTVGNLLRVRHHAGPGSWTRVLTPADDGDRLASTAVGSDLPVAHRHDSRGNLLNLAATDDHLEWDHRDLLRFYDRGGGGRVHYTYDAGRERVRKVSDDPTGTRVAWSRIRLGGTEVYRRYSRGAVVEHVESVHVGDGVGRVLVVDDVLVSDQVPAGPRYRFQVYDHLASSTVELTETGAVLSYEEYYPHGATAYSAVDKDIRTTAKRYRFTGRERDEESGLSLHGARYYAPWLGRWTSADPSGLVGGINPYTYAHANPVELRDDNGKWPEFVDKLRKDPGATLKQAAATVGKVALSYAETRLTQLSDKAQMLNPVTATVTLGAAAVQKVTTEVKAVKAAYQQGGGGAKGAAHATARALAGSVGAHVGDSVAKAVKSGGGAAKAVDAGLAALADDTKELNPLYQLGVGVVGAPTATYDALQRGDTTAAGKHLAEGQQGLEEAAQALIPLAAEAGAFSKARPDLTVRAMSGGESITHAEGGTLPISHEKAATVVAEQMESLGIPERYRGYTDLDTGRRVPAYEPVETGRIGSNVREGSAHSGIGIDAGVLRGIPEWTAWNEADLPARVQAVTQHEWWEFKGFEHAEALLEGHAQRFTLPIGEGAKAILRSMGLPRK